MLLDHLLCPKMNFPCAQRGDEPVPKIFRKECCHGHCTACDKFQASEYCLLQCPKLFDESVHYKWKEYGKTLLDNGKEIQEIQCKSGSLQQFQEKFTTTLKSYKAHYFNYKWLNLVRKADLAGLKPDELFIQTDYSAQPALDSQDKLNSVGHGVCVLSCWVVLHSPRQESYEVDGERKYYTFYECDHIRVVTPSTGKCKDQDWFLHCKIFEQLIEKYKVKIPGLRRIILWTDGAPNQYKCRQNFFWLSKVYEKLGVLIVHRFGATAQFKGVHDKVGQVAKWAVK
jgi:hypothetical protein